MVEMHGSERKACLSQILIFLATFLLFLVMSLLYNPPPANS